MKLAFASCCKLQNVDPQPVWNEIRLERPDALLLLGDNVYLDHDRHGDPAALGAELRGLYAAQFAEPAFAALLADLKARGAPLIAIYDDHDFLGNNRYGGDHPTGLRDAARDEFVRAFAPATTGRDVYAVHRLGLVDIVLLDARYYRTAPATAGGDRDAVLGLQQWQWLERTLATPSPAKYTLIASSTTLHTFADESWEQYPGAFQRLAGLLRGRVGAMVVSGDVHRNAAYDESGVIEIVSSAIARKGIVFGTPRKNYGLMNFDANRVEVDLRSLKVQWRMKFAIPLADWRLP